MGFIGRRRVCKFVVASAICAFSLLVAAERRLHAQGVPCGDGSFCDAGTQCCEDGNGGFLCFAAADQCCTPEFACVPGSECTSCRGGFECTVDGQCVSEPVGCGDGTSCDETSQCCPNGTGGFLCFAAEDQCCTAEFSCRPGFECTDCPGGLDCTVGGLCPGGPIDCGDGTFCAEGSQCCPDGIGGFLCFGAEDQCCTPEFSCRPGFECTDCPGGLDCTVGGLCLLDACVGDDDNSSDITADEVVLAINAFARDDVSLNLAADGDENGSVDAGEVVQVINNFALDECNPFEPLRGIVLATPPVMVKPVGTEGG